MKKGEKPSPKRERRMFVGGLSICRGEGGFIFLSGNDAEGESELLAWGKKGNRRGLWRREISLNCRGPHEPAHRHGKSTKGKRENPRRGKR